MPFKKNYKRKYRRKKRSYGTGTAIAGASTTPVPKRMLVKARYCDAIVLNAPNSGTAHHTFCANGIFDPDQTGTGHQPLGHDQWSQFYEKYTVLGSKITAEFISAENGSTAVGTVGISLTENTAFSPSLTELRERGDNCWGMLGSFDGKNASRKLSKTCSVKKWKGIKNLLNEDRLMGECTSANPAEQLHFQVWQSAVRGTDDPGACEVLITLEYIIMYHTPIQVSGS